MPKARPLTSTPLYYARTEKGLLIEDVSKATGIRVSSIRYLETHRPNRVTRNALILSKFYDLPMEKIMSPREHQSPLFQLRLARKLSIAEAAKRTSLSIHSLRAFEAGTKMSRKTIERLAAFYGVKPIELDATYTPPGWNSVEDFAKLVTKYRKARGLTMTQLGKAVKITGKTIWNIEHGLCGGSRETRLRIASALGIPESKVLNFDLRREPSEKKRKETVTPTVKPQSLFDEFILKNPPGKVFVFTPKIRRAFHIEQYKTPLLKFCKSEGKYLFFKDPGGCTRTFTQQQLSDYRIRPATEQEVYIFENPKWG